jgi:catechol 2,3-dioxygenase-like lactoylglutathione lyase family enzyme
MKTRAGEPFMSAPAYGRSLPKFSVNLLVRDVAKSVPFYRDVLGATVRYADGDFAAPALLGVDFMLHADHAFQHHPLYTTLQAARERGVGAELRFLGVDPDQVEKRAKRSGSAVLQSSKSFPHGWREVTVLDPDGYVWVPSVTQANSGSLSTG